MDEQLGYGEDSAFGLQMPATIGAGSLLRRVRERLGDVRIHDDRLADDLTRRLGARAFTIGRDVYVRPDLLRPGTPQGEALLAHELFHVTEQTGVDMPLLRPSQSFNHGGGMDGHASLGMRSTTHVQRAAASDQPAPASTSSSEMAAEAIEAQVVRQTEEAAKGGGKPPDPEEVADRVYALIALDLILERERAAYGW